MKKQKNCIFSYHTQKTLLIIVKIILKSIFGSQTFRQLVIININIISGKITLGNLTHKMSWFNVDITSLQSSILDSVGEVGIYVYVSNMILM